MKNLQGLIVEKQRLKSAMQMMDSQASFETEEGRVYAQVLVKLVVIEMQMEALEKKKAAQ